MITIPVQDLHQAYLLRAYLLRAYLLRHHSC